MLVTSISSFFHNVFYPSQNKFHIFIHVYFVVCTCFQFGPAFSPFPTMFSTLHKTNFTFSFMFILSSAHVSIWTSIFSFSHDVFYPSQNKFHIFIHVYFVVCTCFQLGPAFFPFPTMFSTLHKTNFTFSFTFILSSAHAFNLDQHFLLFQMFSTLHKTNVTFSFMFILSSAHAFNLDQHFFLFQQCFLPFTKQISHFHSRLFCRLHMLQFGPVQKYVVW